MPDKYEDYSREELLRLLRERDRKPKFGLVWERDEIDHDKSLNDDFVALELDAAFSCGDAPYRNFIIEGDNFDALRYLRMTHAGRVRCILIDPPYNTGNRDFIYNDRFLDAEDVYKHSKWLEYLYRRLVLAKELLAEDGVMMVCINDDNRSRLELLLDQLMPGMRVGSMVWRTRDSTSRKGNNFSDVHEHILIYGGPLFAFQGAEKSQKKYKNPDKDPRGPWNIDPLTVGADRFERQGFFYPIENPKTSRWYPCDPNRVWAYSTERNISGKTKLASETMEEWIRQDKIVFPDPATERVVVWNTLEELLAAIDARDIPVTPKKKIPLLSRDTPDLAFWVGKQVGFGRPGFKKHWRDLRSHINPVGSWIARINEQTDDEDTTTLRSREAGEGTGALQAIFGHKVFNHPKPPSLMKQLISQSTDEDGLVVDFFAGSGTTAQAVLQLNAEDEGSRRFIMVSSTEANIDEPDKNVCRDVCAPRIKAVIEGFGGRPGTGGNFAYLRTQRIPVMRVFNDIRHDQVWLALQLIHSQPLAAFDDGASIQVAGDAGKRLLYVSQLSEVSVAEVERLANDSSSLVVYSWQPGQLRQRITTASVSFEKIPEFLVSRFGGER